MWGRRQEWHLGGAGSGSGGAYTSGHMRSIRDVGASMSLPDPDRLASAVSRVTSTMAGIRFCPAAPAASLPRCWRGALLPIPGRRPLTIALFADRASCAALTAAMLSCAVNEVDLAMIDDALCELVNMTAGQIKNELAPSQALGLPRALDAAPVFAASGDWAHVALHAGELLLVVSLAERVY